jgi:hypothetical protein
MTRDRAGLSGKITGADFKARVAMAVSHKAGIAFLSIWDYVKAVT